MCTRSSVHSRSVLDCWQHIMLTSQKIYGCLKPSSELEIMSMMLPGVEKRSPHAQTPLEQASRGKDPVSLILHALAVCLHHECITNSYVSLSVMQLINILTLLNLTKNVLTPLFEYSVCEIPSVCLPENILILLWISR